MKSAIANPNKTSILTEILKFELSLLSGNQVFTKIQLLLLLFVFYFFAGEVIHLSDVKDFPLTLWLIFIICVAYYVAIFPFIAIGL